LERLDVDRQIDQRVERANGADVACFGSFDTQVLGLTVDAFAGGALVVDDVIKGTLTIQGHAHQATGFLVDIFDTAFLAGETAGGRRSLASAQERAGDSDSVGRGSRLCAGTGMWGACVNREDTTVCHQDHAQRRDGHVG
jgi:hypothetical protein